VSTSFVNNQFQFVPFGTNVADAGLAQVSPLIRGLSHVESCGELAAMVDIKFRWTYIDSRGLKATRNEILRLEANKAAQFLRAPSI
jgi:hypothetical protein